MLLFLWQYICINFHKEYMKMLSEDYEYDLVNVKKCWILLTNIYDFIENDEMGWVLNVLLN